MCGSRSGISNLTGLAGAANVQGEDQKKLDVVSNTVFCNALRASGRTVAFQPAFLFLSKAITSFCQLHEITAVKVAYKSLHSNLCSLQLFSQVSTRR